MPMTHRLLPDPPTGKAGRPSVFTRPEFVQRWPLWELRVRTGKASIAAAADALHVSRRTVRRLIEGDYRKQSRST